MTNPGRDSRKEGSNSLDTPIPLILLHQRMLEEEARVEPAHVVVPTQIFSIVSDPYFERASRLAATGKKQRYSRKVACEPHTSPKNDHSNNIEDGWLRTSILHVIPLHAIHLLLRLFFVDPVRLVPVLLRYHAKLDARGSQVADAANNNMPIQSTSTQGINTPTA